MSTTYGVNPRMGIPINSSRRMRPGRIEAQSRKHSLITGQVIASDNPEHKALPSHGERDVSYTVKTQKTRNTGQAPRVGRTTLTAKSRRAMSPANDTSVITVTELTPDQRIVNKAYRMGLIRSNRISVNALTADQITAVIDAMGATYRA